MDQPPFTRTWMSTSEGVRSSRARVRLQFTRLHYGVGRGGLPASIRHCDWPNRCRLGPDAPRQACRRHGDRSPFDGSNNYSQVRASTRWRWSPAHNSQRVSLIRPSLSSTLDRHVSHPMSLLQVCALIYLTPRAGGNCIVTQWTSSLGRDEGRPRSRATSQLDESEVDAHSSALDSSWVGTVPHHCQQTTRLPSDYVN